MNRPMIKKLTLLAALPAAILAANASMAAVEVYGKVNVSLQQNGADQDDGTAAATNGDIYDNNTWESNASRFGIKASTDIGDSGLKAVAKIEYEVFVDDGQDGSSGDELKQRNIYGGLQGGFGTVIAGKFDTPLKESQGKIDLFNDLILGDISNVLLVGEIRADNIVMYSTPKLESGLGAHIAAMSGEDTGLAGADENNGMLDYISASITYDSEMFYAALAHDTASAPAGATVNATSGAEITRLTGQLKLGDFVLGALYQMAESADNNNIDGVDSIFQYGNIGASAGSGRVFGTTYNWGTHVTDQDGLILSAQYTLDKHVFKLQYGMSEGTAETPTLNGAAPNQFMTYVSNGDDLEIELMSVGYDYVLDKKTRIFAYYSDYSAEQSTVASVNREVNADTLGLGFEYSF